MLSAIEVDSELYFAMLCSKNFLFSIMTTTFSTKILNSNNSKSCALLISPPETVFPLNYQLDPAESQTDTPWASTASTFHISRSSPKLSSNTKNSSGRITSTRWTHQLEMDLSTSHYHPTVQDCSYFQMLMSTQSMR